MSLFKRKDSPYWYFKIVHDGQTIQRSTGTTDKQKAQEYHDKLKAQLWDETRLGIKPAYTWNEAVVRWLKERQYKATYKEDVMKLRWSDRFLGNLELRQINRDRLDRMIEAKLNEGVSNTTVNRYMEVIRAILNAAANEWEWLDKAPKVRMLPTSKQRIRWLTHEEANRLLSELPPHLNAMANFSLETGLRKSNVTGLEWSQIDLERRMAWVHPDQAKARKAIPVPLSELAVSILKAEIGKHTQFAFTYLGKPIIQVNTAAWHKALKRAGIKDFRWHDLRHTWASWHVQAGTPLYVLQELGGWSCVEMVKRYAHLSSEHLVEFVDKMSEKQEPPNVVKQEATNWLQIKNDKEVRLH